MSRMFPTDSLPTIHSCREVRRADIGGMHYGAICLYRVICGQRRAARKPDWRDRPRTLCAIQAPIREASAEQELGECVAESHREPCVSYVRRRRACV